MLDSNSPGTGPGDDGELYDELSLFVIGRGAARPSPAGSVVGSRGQVRSRLEALFESARTHPAPTSGQPLADRRLALVLLRGYLQSQAIDRLPNDASVAAVGSGALGAWCLFAAASGLVAPALALAAAGASFAVAAHSLARVRAWYLMATGILRLSGDEVFEVLTDPDGVRERVAGVSASLVEVRLLPCAGEGGARP